MAASLDAPAPTDAKHGLDHDAIIVGAGMSGLYPLIRLRELGMRVRVFEAGEGGGGWLAQYCALVKPLDRCDVLQARDTKAAAE